MNRHVPRHSDAATALRAALVCPYPELRAAARKVVERALACSRSLREAAVALGISSNTLDRIRAENPDLGEPAGWGRAGG